MDVPTQASRPMRADAQRNYDSLLKTARVAVSERGAEIVLEDIAKSAGVAIGTLYRHFPTRQDLLEAVFLDETNELKVRAEEFANASEPFDALISWLRIQMEFAARGRSMGAAVLATKHVPGTKIYLANSAMLEAGNVLLQHAKAAASVRADVQLVDVIRLTYGIVLVNEYASDPEGISRMFDIVIAGIARNQAKAEQLH